MKRCLIFLFTQLFFLSAMLKAQETTGIRFESSLSWSDVQAKARSEDKYIFIDVYATWCVPCKEMDHAVYTNDTIGKYFNEHFISIKCQIDSSKADNEQIRSWYSDAKAIASKFKVKFLPTFLFLTPDGNLVQEDAGLKSVTGFKELAVNANNARQYFYLLDKYKNGEADYSVLPEFINMSAYHKEYIVPDSLIENYFSKYLPSLPNAEILTRPNLLFAGAHLIFLHSSTKLFQTIYQNMAETDSLTFPGYANQVVSIVIRKEEIEDKLWADFSNAIPRTKNPDWGNIEMSIRKKYSQHYSDSLVLPTKFDFYDALGNYDEFARLADSVIKKYPPVNGSTKLVFLFGDGTIQHRAFISDAEAINDLAWEVFLFCSDKKILKHALTWSDLSIKLAKNSSRVAGIMPPFLPGYLDTKANLLYKIGKKEEAIDLEKEAIENLKGTTGDLPKVYERTIERMKKGEPTWKEREKMSE